MHITERNRQRTVVIGLDGLPFSLAQKLGNEGICPHIHSLVQSGNAHPMQAELPELSPVNWTSFYTASGPEEHGIFGFTKLNPATYQIEIADSSHVRTSTIFDVLGQKNLYSKVINLPNTYPASPIHGVLISGFVATDLRKAVHPPPLANMLLQEGYRLEADTISGSKDFEFLIRELASTLDGRLRALDLLWPDLSWDLFVLVFTETDRMFHFLYPALIEKSHPFHGPCLEFMKKWDRAIGDILERFQALPGPKRLIALADHGFTALKREVDLNAWLKMEGFFHPGRAAANELDAGCISSGSRAFCLDPGRIYIHDKKRFSHGLVPESGKKELAEDIKGRLADLSFCGEKVIAEIYSGEYLYPSCEGPEVPDLVCVPQKGFDLKGKFNRYETFGLFERHGCHTADDAFFYDSHGTQAKRTREAGQAVLDYFSSPGIIV